ncbi:DUF4252 domain-containing protein [Candidatus Poribacteria bacterium]|nr:DUF4252 domain-containing protein [Candidatus Poribacteria bacterium]
MKYYRNLIWPIVLLSGLLIIIRSSVAEAQEETNIRGHIAFDFPKTSEPNIEINLSGKLIRLVAKAAKNDQEAAKLLEMLEGVYVRGYRSGDTDFGEVSRYYKNKLKEEGWEVIAKVKEDDETFEVHTLFDQDIINGLFIMIAETEQTIFVNVFGRINPEQIGELLDSLDVDDLGNLDIGMHNFDVDVEDRNRGFGLHIERSVLEELDWRFEGTDISVISAETTNGAITFEDSVRDEVIVRASKKVRARGIAGAEAFAKKVHVYAERDGKEIKIYKKHPKPPKGVDVSVAYEIQCPAGVSANLHTTNGSIDLKLSGNFSGQIDAKTSKGRVLSDFPIPFTDKSEKQLAGKIGDGGSAKVKLRTTDGNINVKKW